LRLLFLWFWLIHHLHESNLTELCTTFQILQSVHLQFSLQPISELLFITILSSNNYDYYILVYAPLNINFHKRDKFLTHLCSYILVRTVTRLLSRNSFTTSHYQVKRERKEKLKRPVCILKWPVKDIST
jgi:hypothetical protein